MPDLINKNIIITGASSGIGRACAIECSKAGARVHLLSRNMEKLKEVATKLEPDSFTLNVLDVTKSEEIERVVKEIVDKYGLISGFIHSAGIQVVSPLKTQDKMHFMEVFSVNTFAAFDMGRILTKKAYADSRGMSFVFISSVMSVAADAGLTSYCASKAALVGGAKAMAIELAPKKIRVNCVSPGTVEDTAMTQNLKDNISEDEYIRIVNKYPAGLGTTQDVAQLCLFLMSDNSTWITGQNIVIDGAYSAQ